MSMSRTRLPIIISFVLFTATIAAFTQSSAEDPGGTTAPELEASWQVTVTPVGVPIAPFLTYSTFARGGTFLESAQPRQGPGHGVWRRMGDREFGITFEKILFSAEGNFAGTLRVRETIRLTASGDSYAGDGTADVFDPAGRLVASFCARTQAKRITVERPSCP